MNEQSPVVVLVHGAFAESASWNGVVERLQARSIDVVAAPNPLRSLDGDAAYVRDVIAGIGRPVVLVAHSYGGMVITEAAAENPAVKALVYVCAFAPDQGENAFGLSVQFPGSTLGDALDTYPVSTGGNDLRIKPALFNHQFCADVPAEQAAVMAATQRPATDVALTGNLVTASPAWKTIPSWFVFSDEDLNIPVALHRFMAERAGAKDIREVAGASHALSVSAPEPVTAAILDALSA
ncbi:alpha/beta hydrolase [Kribbella sp. NBC_01510]|uniref:alpha/beta fold hydrolase n=1 Tax=Kribbella sp. NBC_01510 TaxID=2903581 RepID=UPI00386DCC83